MRAAQRIAMALGEMPRRLRALAGLTALTLAAGCGSPLVGGECRSGYTNCEGACVDLNEDYRNCGMCGNDCGAYVCNAGMCDMTMVRPPDGMDGMVPEDGDVDAEIPDADMDSSKPDVDPGFDADTGLPGCGVGTVECGQACVDTQTDIMHCGACDSPCDSGEVCSAGDCEPACPDGLMQCQGGCFDTTSDPRHCGACANVCASGICEDSQCADAVPGHVVVFGHTYVRSNKFQSTLLGNALFLGQGAPVRTLVYEGSASAASTAGVNAAINSVANSIGRAWDKTSAVEALVTLQLATADVFLIHAQDQSTDSVLDKLGEAWGMALAEFLVRGGVVVLIEGASRENGGTHRLLEPAAIFSAAGRTALTGRDVEVTAPGTGIALRVGDRYRGETATVGFDQVDSFGTVVSQVGERPVVFHRIIRR